ncbi:RrF2 family transcriptional regulator [Ideonella dechloratans]|uniref:RrF2 family transcriptional regulator n=1 Tax=Ideonella dechloratans TaxID=36863 RepID=UPI0035B3920B
MRLTAMTDYALRLLMYLGRQPDRLCTIAEVAQVHGLSQAHLMKITYQLGQRGWITTVRGKGGGMTLALPPEQINLGAVVRSVEPDFQLVECMGAPAADSCVLTRSCPLTGVVADALQAFLAVLDARTLADVLPPPHALDRAMREVRVDLPARKRIPAGPAAEDVA